MHSRRHLPLAFGVLTLFLLVFASCSSSEGTQIKMPFSGKKYMSDARHFRAVGMGQSANLSVAKSKAELEASQVHGPTSSDQFAGGLRQLRK